MIPSGTKFVGINPNFPTTERKSAQNNAAQDVYTIEEILEEAGGAIGTSYIVVKGNGTEAENAIELQTAYDYATNATPYGNALASDNRFTVLVYPGVYSFESAFELNSSSVDVIAISTLKAEYTQSVIIPNGVAVTASDIRVKGISTMDSPFSVESILGKILIENCSGGDYSFSPIDYITNQGTLDAVFINCQGGNYSFGFYQNAQGSFENCTGGDYSFGSSDDNTVGVGYANGTFTNCLAGIYSFGVFGEAGGVFTNCTSGEYSFGYACSASGLFINCNGDRYCFGVGSNELEILASASGSFTDCTASDFSFGYLNSASGSFTRCIGRNYCFGSDNNSDASGNFTDCTAGDYSFGYKGVASGTFNRCTAGYVCFGSSDSTALISLCTGTFTNCLSTVGYSFGYLGSISAQAVFNNCTSLDNSFSSRGEDISGFLDCDGTFNNCNAGDCSFGYNSNLQTHANFNNCKAKRHSFCGGNSGVTAMDVGTTFNNCIADENSFGALVDFRGQAYYCVGGAWAFGGDAALTGQVYYSKITTGNFITVTSTGVTRYCINSDNTTDNQG